MPLPQASTGSASASVHSASVAAATAAYMSRQDFTHRAISFEEMLERENQRRREREQQRNPIRWGDSVSESLRAVRRRDMEGWQRQVNRVAPRSQGSARSQVDFQLDDLSALEFEITNRSLEAFHSPTRCPRCDTVLSGLICTNDLCSNELASGSSSITIDRTGLLVRDHNGVVRVRSGGTGSSDAGSHVHHISNASIQAGSITGRSIRNAHIDEVITSTNMSVGVNTSVTGNSNRLAVNTDGDQIRTWLDEATRIENELSQNFRTWLNDNSPEGNTRGF